MDFWIEEHLKAIFGVWKDNHAYRTTHHIEPTGLSILWASDPTTNKKIRQRSPILSDESIAEAAEGESAFLLLSRLSVKPHTPIS